ncbi:MAG: HIT family protein [Acidimicrobiia bacterium]|nr:HIT family protein [Acidimicrobiia bacterium]
MNDPDCVFCQIVTGQRPAHVVLESVHALAFLDARPVFPGHSLLVPRDHHTTLGDLPAPLVADFFTDAQRLAVAVEAGMEADGSFVAMNNRVSQSVPHLHVHVVPRRRKDGLRGFFWPRQKYESDEAMGEVAARVRAAVPRP